jgi:hypothetical protein
MRKGTQVQIVGIEAVGRFNPSPLNLREAQAWLNGCNNALGDTVLKIEDVVERSVELVSPYMPA